MAEPGNEMAAGTGGRGRLRASHADREQVIDVLKAAFVEGRLDQDEFSLRVGRVLASRTYADLAALTADIPARLTRARPSKPPGEPANKKKRAAAALACATLAYPGLLAAVPPIPDGSPFLVPVLMVMFALFGAVATGWLVLFHAWLAERAGRQSTQGLPPGPAPGTGRPASPGLPASGRDHQLPPREPGSPYTAQTSRKRLPRPPLPVRGHCASTG
jgi:hypothetical protein